MNPKIDEFISKSPQWQAEIQALRAILLACELSEELKWKQPCYTFNKKNIAILSYRKESCDLGFFKGALLKDEMSILLKPGENTQSSRLIKFTSVQEIEELSKTIKSYIQEAIEVEKAGLTVESKKNTDLEFPEELHGKFTQDPAFKTAFEALTPGRQRGYTLFFNAAKQSKTREARIEKYVQRILDGYGIHDCTCGLSKKMPSCDGSHKLLQ